MTFYGVENMKKAIAYVLIKAEPGHEHEVYYSLAKREIFMEIHPVVGEYSVVAKVVADDLDRIGYIVLAEMGKTEFVDSYETLMATA